jgi:SAM-dependent methyltransferase
MIAGRYDALAGADAATRSRRGVRDDGSVFTIDTLGRYHLHDLVHHAHDVRAFAARATVAAYDVDAEAFGEAVAELNDDMRQQLDAFAAAVGTGGAVLEIGSGGGRDAVAMAERGLLVRATDISPGFVELMRGRGIAAEVLDPLTDELGGPYDGIWANACLLHVPRADLPVVLRRLADATRPGGVLGLSLKEGDGETWSVHGHVRGPRRFVFWREEPLRQVLAETGWRVEELSHWPAVHNNQQWLSIRASRRAA